ncbi:uncharacterized protein LOC141690686 [Apium graveolens]|uniref:uncharacterized protein LOC141690686 n=1 Tax=Apium graveolens TaxID=4045 RepID=UPI003D79876B
MFVNILAYSPISDPLRLWEANWQCMSDDILIIRRHMLNDPHLYLLDEDLKNYALAEIEKLFNDIGKSLKDYATMPFPSEVYFSNAVIRLLQEETSYDKEELKILHEKNHGMLNPEHKNVYDSIIQNVYNKDSTTGIRHGTDIAELIQQTNLIIWDEEPMQHRHAFESVDRSLRDIMFAIDKRRANKPFCGIIVVFGGDYRQILPVIPKESRAEVVGSTLNKSKIWEFCQVFLFKQNMRLHAGNTEMENKIIADFSKWQLLIGDGKVENFSPDADTGEMLIKIPDQYVVHTTPNPIESLFEITYPDFLRNMSSHSYLRLRAILTPTNVVVDNINNSILEKIPGTLHTYLSQDSIDDADMKYHHHLSNLDGNHTAWTLKVRVTRMWVSTNRQGVLVRHNLILLDYEVLPAAGFLRPVRSAKYIMFLPIIVVVLEPEEILNVIGIVELLQPVQSIMTRFGEKEVLRFTISDGV